MHSAYHKLIFLTLFLATIRCFAQEVLVPLDSTGKIEVIDSELEQKLQIFTEYENFREARLYQHSDTNFVLEITYQPQDKVLKTRKPLTFDEVFDLRSKIDSLIHSEAPQALLNQSGRVKLIAGTTLVGLGFYGWAVPVALDVSSGSAAVSLYLLTGAASFFIPYASTLHSTVTDAAATMARYGETRGIAHGVMLGYLLGGSDPDGRAVIASALVTSVTEGIVLFGVANSSNMSDGKAMTIATGGDFGIGIGAGTAVLLDFFDDNRDRQASGTMLAGSAAGMMTGNWLANQQNFTRGDAYVFRNAGWLGTLAGITLANIADTKEKASTVIVMTGAVGGLGLGNYLVKDKDFSTNDGLLITFAELGGGLAGLGLAYAIDSHGNHSEIYTVSATVGATTGFWLMYNSFQHRARVSHKETSWNLNIAPEGIAQLALGDNLSNHSRTALPLFRLNVTF